MIGFPEQVRRTLRPLASPLAAVLLLAAGCAYYNTFYNAQVYYRQGRELQEQKSATQAKAKFEKSIEKSALVISRWPKSPWVDDATFLIGKSYYEMGHYKKALRYLERLELVFPESPHVPEAEFYRGLALLGDRDYGVARVVLGEVVQRFPRYRDDAAFRLAEADYLREDYRRAVDSLAGFIERFPRSEHAEQALRYLAEASFELEDWDRSGAAYGRYSRLVAEPKERASAQLKVAACRLALGDNSACIRQARDVLGRYRDLDDETYLLLGRALYADSQVGEALGAWSRVRGSNDYGAEAFFRIGRHHEEGRDFDLARVHYDTARSRRANSDYGVLAVARLSLLNAFAAGDSSGREADQAMFLLAEVHNLNLGEHEEAMRLYQMVYDSFPESELAPKGLFARAWLMKSRMSDTTELTPLLERIIAEYPETEYADESRRWLGLPVPKRAPKPKPDTVKTVVPADTLEGKGTAGRPDGLPGLLPDEEGRLREELTGRAGGPVLLGDEPPSVLPDSMPEEAPSTPGLVPPDSLAGVTPERPTLPLPVEPDTVPTEPDTLERGAEPEPERSEPRMSMLDVVRFDADSWAIRPDDARILEGHAERLLADPGIALTLVGHDDPLGTEEHADSLGLRRAEAVMGFLVEAGVEAERFDVRSEGRRRVLSTSPEEYWLDRRVEFVLR